MLTRSAPNPGRTAVVSALVRWEQAIVASLRNVGTSAFICPNKHICDRSPLQTSTHLLCMHATMPIHLRYLPYRPICIHSQSILPTYTPLAGAYPLYCCIAASFPAIRRTAVTFVPVLQECGYALSVLGITRTSPRKQHWCPIRQATFGRSSGSIC